MTRFLESNPVASIVLSSILGIIGLCVGGCSAKCLGGLNWKFSEGSRSGVVQKISKSGVIWKTWEGELNLGYNTSLSNGDATTIVPAIFYFSCSSDEAAKKVQAAERKGDRVTLEYTHYFLRGWKYGGTGYDVTNVGP